ncbi:MAG: right-handed parallel beta-helix repeat-containing protein, partial [Candidatus Cloacimonadota bacterium]|nr:right-handed parallel beta-helix repeat-containing protein [Candidatus Cloacimonadota bacterium]
TEQDTIYFYREDNLWGGINFIQTPVSNDSSKFSYCKITKAAGGAIEIESYNKVIISNCTIRNNRRTDHGGGINCLNAELNIRNSNICRNLAINYDDFATCGGAIYLENSYLKLENCIISRSFVYGEYEVEGGAGAGMYIINSSCDITNCEIFGNYSIIHGGPSYGGGLYAYNSQLDISNTIIRDNEMTAGSGLYICDSNGIIINSLVHNNHTDGGFMDGQGIGISISDFDIINTIVCDNSAYGMTGSGNINIINSIFTNNTYEQIHLSGGYQGCYTTANILYSAVEDGINGVTIGNPGWVTFNWLEGNIEDDPLFIDPDNGNFHFFSDSPCINAGTPDTTGLNLPEYDLDGNPRIYEDLIDMGCYEWQGTDADDIQLPMTSYQLYNYPNPFNPSTTISFSIEQNQINELIEINIYNVKGQRVKSLPVILSDPAAAGRIEGQRQNNQYSIIWDGTDENKHPVSSGIYFYQLKVDGEVKQTKKMMLIK